MAKEMFARLRGSCEHGPLSNRSCNRYTTELQIYFWTLAFSILPELRTAVYHAAIMNGTVDDFFFLLSKVDIEPHAAEKERILGGITGTANISMVHL